MSRTAFPLPRDGSILHSNFLTLCVILQQGVGGRKSEKSSLESWRRFGITLIKTIDNNFEGPMPPNMTNKWRPQVF